MALSWLHRLLKKKSVPASRSGRRAPALEWLSERIVPAVTASFLPGGTLAIFGDHMVWQRGVKGPVWGTADPGEKVVVKAAGQEKSSQADADGKWRVVLDPIEPQRPLEISVAGNNSLGISGRAVFFL